MWPQRRWSTDEVSGRSHVNEQRHEKNERECINFAANTKSFCFQFSFKVNQHEFDSRVETVAGNCDCSFVEMIQWLTHELHQSPTRPIWPINWSHCVCSLHHETICTESQPSIVHATLCFRNERLVLQIEFEIQLRLMECFQCKFPVISKDHTRPPNRRFSQQ